MLSALFIYFVYFYSSSLSVSISFLAKLSTAISVFKLYICVISSVSSLIPSCSNTIILSMMYLFNGCSLLYLVNAYVIFTSSLLFYFF
nr:MAG TPA: hypothetical protein [Caudoviricetes sp.]